MQDSDLKRALKEKSIDNVKRVNPKLKKFIVTAINNIGRFFFIFKTNKLPKDVNRILFISLYFNGDILFQSSLFELVHRIYPDAKIDIWVKSRTKGVLEGYPYLNRVYIFDNIRTRRFDENVRLNLKGKFKFFKLLKSEKYDLIYDVTGLFWTAFAVFWANPKYSSGLNFHGFGFLYNFETQAIYNGHLIDKHLNLLLKNKQYNIETKELEFIRKPAYYTTERSKSVIDDIFDKYELSNGRNKIAVHTTAGWESKTWDIENFINLIKIISKSFDIFIIGGNEDKKNAELIVANAFTNVYDFTSLLSINESAELISRAALYIGADSGPLYIAEAVGTPTLSLFGPTNPLFSAPRGDGHKFIYHELFCSADENTQNCKLNAGLNCRTFDCMKTIKSGEVLELVNNLIG